MDGQLQQPPASREANKQRRHIDISDPSDESDADGEELAVVNHTGDVEDDVVTSAGAKRARGGGEVVSVSDDDDRRDLANEPARLLAADANKDFAKGSGFDIDQQPQRYNLTDVDSSDDDSDEDDSDNETADTGLIPMFRDKTTARPRAASLEVVGVKAAPMPEDAHDERQDCAVQMGARSAQSSSKGGRPGTMAKRGVPIAAS